MELNFPEGLEAFLAQAGWQGAAIEPLAGDASFRRYFRIRQGERSAMLMDAPPPNEDPAPFLRAAKWLVNRPPGLYTMQDVLGLH